MALPEVSLYPDSFDSDDNLYVVHDALRASLSQDYNPGDTSISIIGDFYVLQRWPETGIITLTEQCSDVDQRAVSLHYSSIVVDQVTAVISGLTLKPNFVDSFKPKRITNVTCNVVEDHHNNAKDAVIAIEEFIGIKGTMDTEPLGDTMEGRINFLRSLVLPPKPWFSVDKRTGIVPLEVEFSDRSFRLGTDGNSGPIHITWDFGDQTTSTISILPTISATSMVPIGDVDVIVRDTDGGKIKKIYNSPGIYTVKMTASNNFGEDTVIFEDIINARIKAPDPAIIRFIENTSTQDADPGVPPNGPFSTTPTIRSPINTLIQIDIESGENISIPGYSFAGEPLNSSGSPIDPIINYTWSLGDDLNHENSPSTKASYGIGGVYDLKLRVETQYGAYRITTYEDAIDIIENTNLWLWTYQTTSTVRAYEYGMISETFKTTPATTLAIVANDDFLNDVPDEDKQKKEFSRNTAFVPRGTLPSGQGGTALLYWASGRSAAAAASTETIQVTEFEGFTGTYISRASISRPWNWASFNSNSLAYFAFGSITGTQAPGVSITNVTKQTQNLADLTVSSADLTSSNYINGAGELEQNPATFDEDGDPIYGHYSVYRTAFKDSTGYLARNDAVGPFFRIKSFYRTEGTVGSPFINIRKLADIAGTTKLEGAMTDLSQGIYFLNNSGLVSKFGTTEGVWTTGGPGFNSTLYRNLQDTEVSGFDNQANTLLLASDHDKKAYISFDYSPNAFLKFNEINTTFSTLGSRPSGDQWLLGVW